jgi:uncharacterized protein
MHIGLISDTHIPHHAKKLPAQIKDVFCGVDLILHAGDVFAPYVFDELERIAPVLASRGDEDILDIADDKRVKWKQVFTFEGVTIWLVHRRPMAWPIISVPQLEKPPDVYVFGDTHEAALENHSSILRINPGSPTFPHYRLELGTVGLLTVSEGKAEAKIVQLQ